MASVPVSDGNVPTMNSSLEKGEKDPTMQEGPTPPPAYRFHETPRQHPLYALHPYTTAGYEYHRSIHIHPTLPSSSHPRARARSSSIRRFCSGFAFAILVWILVSAAIQSMMLISHYGSLFVSVNDWPSDEDFPIPPDLVRVRCAWGDESGDQTQLRASFKKILRAPLTFPFKVQEEFNLPLEANKFFFLSRGVYSGGRIKIKRSDVDDVEVKVRLEYLRPGAPKIAKVCQFWREDGAAGLGVFTPEIPKYHQHNLAFFITVKLPKSSPISDDDYLHIEKLETDMPNFAHRLGKLAKGIVFDEISLKTTNGAILVDSLVAEQGTLENSNGPVTLHYGELGSFDVLSRNGPIHGVFNATGSLVLKTTNRQITGRVYINTDEDGYAKLELGTTNSYVDTEIFLKNSGEGKPGGEFDVTASSHSGPIKLRFSDAPLDSKLNLTVKDKNSPVDVTLHPTFEGDFNVTSVHLLPRVLVRQRVDDPSGEARERHVELSRKRWSVTGNASWSEEGEGRGQVNLETKNSPVVLRL